MYLVKNQTKIENDFEIKQIVIKLATQNNQTYTAR